MNKTWVREGNPFLPANGYRLGKYSIFARELTALSRTGHLQQSGVLRQGARRSAGTAEKGCRMLGEVHDGRHWNEFSTQQVMCPRFLPYLHPTTMRVLVIVLVFVAVPLSAPFGAPLGHAQSRARRPAALGCSNSETDGEIPMVDADVPELIELHAAGYSIERFDEFRNQPFVLWRVTGRTRYPNRSERYEYLAAVEGDTVLSGRALFVRLRATTDASLLARYALATLIWRAGSRPERTPAPHVDDGTLRFWVMERPSSTLPREVRVELETGASNVGSLF